MTAFGDALAFDEGADAGFDMHRERIVDSIHRAATMLIGMRTTVTLDPDVVEQLKAFARRRNISFKLALNTTVRAGLAAERGGGRPYKAPARPMRLKPGADLTHALRIADSLEDGEIVRKLELRK